MKKVDCNSILNDKEINKAETNIVNKISCDMNEVAGNHHHSLTFQK